MSFLMYVKHMKIFTNNAKKLKMSPKLENIKNSPKYQETICSDYYFR